MTVLMLKSSYFWKLGYRFFFFKSGMFRDNGGGLMSLKDLWEAMLFWEVYTFQKRDEPFSRQRYTWTKTTAQNCPDTVSLFPWFGDLKGSGLLYCFSFANKHSLYCLWTHLARGEGFLSWRNTCQAWLINRVFAGFTPDHSLHFLLAHRYDNKDICPESLFI